MRTIRCLMVGLMAAAAVMVTLVAAPSAAAATAPSSVSSAESVAPAATCRWTVIGDGVRVRYRPSVTAAVYAYKYHGDIVTGPCGYTYWNADEQRLWQALYTYDGRIVWIASEWIR
jgi:hypothetical protein